MTRVLAFSPHLDDAVFSAGGTLARLAAVGAEVTVATVFTASVPDPQGFALACQLDKGLGPEVDYMALRRAEDAAACRAVGAAPRHLPFREAPHRGYGSAPELFAGVRADDDAAEAVAPALAALVDALRPDLVFAPQAVGAHVDHVQVVRALDALRLDRPILWWRDHPYVVRPGTPREPFGARFAEQALAEAPLDPAARAARTAGALAYASQLGFQFGGPEAARAVFAAADPVERFRTDAHGRTALAQALGQVEA